MGNMSIGALKVEKKKKKYNLYKWNKVMALPLA